MNIKDKVKQLELQVDQIIGYHPSGHPWRQEYLLRYGLIEKILPTNAKLQAIQKKLKRLYKELPYRQGYIYYVQQGYWKPPQERRPIKVFDWHDGKQVTKYL